MRRRAASRCTTTRARALQRKGLTHALVHALGHAVHALLPVPIVCPKKKKTSFGQSKFLPTDLSSTAAHALHKLLLNKLKRIEIFCFKIFKINFSFFLSK